MDNLAHTLTGAALAETGLKRTSRFATAALVVGANIPDVDALAAFGGADASLLLRRGLTHGVVALALWPLVLTGLLLLIDRRWPHPARDGGAPATGVRVGPLLLLSTVGTLSHPALDWLNTYGVRLLMPFDGRWFYGDSVFIIDPWLWLLVGAGVVLARSATRLGAGGWIALATATTALVTTASFTAWPAKVAWLIGVVGILLFRFWPRVRLASAAVARAGLAGAAIYIVAMIAGSVYARGLAADDLAARGIAPRALVANPPPANPFAREIIVVFDDRYTFLRTDLLRGTVAPGGEDVPRGGPPEVVAAAFGAAGLEGLRNWSRLPAFDAEPLPAGGWTVRIRDVRYPGFGGRGPGAATVTLDASLRVVAVRSGS